MTDSTHQPQTANIHNDASNSSNKIQDSLQNNHTVASRPRLHHHLDRHRHCCQSCDCHCRRSRRHPRRGFVASPALTLTATAALLLLHFPSGIFTMASPSSSLFSSFVNKHSHYFSVAKNSRRLAARTSSSSSRFCGPAFVTNDGHGNYYFVPRAAASMAPVREAASSFTSFGRRHGIRANFFTNKRYGHCHYAIGSGNTNSSEEVQNKSIDLKGGSSASPLQDYSKNRHESQHYEIHNENSIDSQGNKNGITNSPINGNSNSNFDTSLHAILTNATITDEQWNQFTESTFSETLHLPSISVPSRHVHFLISDKKSPLKPYLALTMKELEGVHPRIKVVRENGDSDKSRKRILLSSHVLLQPNNNNANANSSDGNNASTIKFNDDPLAQLIYQYPSIPTTTLQLLHSNYQIQPTTALHPIHLTYHNQPLSRLLSALLPPHLHPPPSSYEQIGHIAHLNLRAPHLPYKHLLGRLLLDKLSPSIRTVVNKSGEVGGPYRTYSVEVLAGKEDYVVNVTEHGISLRFDLRKVYWCTRLEGERTYMLEREFREGEFVADAFCGVGALCLRAVVGKRCKVVGNDWNEEAVGFLRESARRNGVRVLVEGEEDADVRVGGAGGEEGTLRVHCGDAREFIMNLGMGTLNRRNGDDDHDHDDSLLSSTANLPHHLILNFPLDSPSFLNALRWWPSGEEMKVTPRVHVYTFARGDADEDEDDDGVGDDDSDDRHDRKTKYDDGYDENYGDSTTTTHTGTRTALDVAVDLVADGLLPEGGYIEPSKFRREQLDALGCNVQAREIRDAAPGKLVVCVSFSVTRLLLRRMQGDYGF